MNLQDKPCPSICLHALAAVLSATAALAASSYAADVQPAPDGRLIAVPGSSVVVQLWESADAASHYAISFDGRTFSDPIETSYVIKLNHGAFDPLALGAMPAVEEGFAADEETNLHIVQFHTQPLEAYRDAIAASGGDVHFFLANHSYIVRMDAAARDAVAALPFVRWVGAYHPAYRLEGYLLDNAANASTLFPWHRYNVMLVDETAAKKSAVAQRIADLGGVVDLEYAGKYRLEATLTPAQLFEIVRMDEILYIDRWSPIEDDMNNSRIIGGANYVESVAGYTGQGVRGESYDSGFNPGHGDFASRPLIVHGGTVDISSHGASTSGICFGDGTGNADARGLLPDGQGIIADYGNAGLTGPNRYAHSGELVQSPYFAVFQTCSAGSSRTTQYTTISADHDAIMFDFDILFCQSQSNSGWEDSRPQAWAKNIVSGGGIRHYDTLTKADDCWCGGASIGPASDGRIKPDLCHFYDNIFTVTCCGVTSYTTSFGGTSGATPNICGYTGLFFQMWSEGIFGNPVNPSGTVFENRSHMTTAKAMMINTASQYEFSGAGHDLTRVHQGWGMPDVENLYDLRGNMLIIDETEILENLDTATYVVTVEPGQGEFRATLVFADPPGNPAASVARINDLSLKVTDPGGTVYWGNNGLLENMHSTPGGSANHVDTVENVWIAEPPAGAWTVQVIAEEIVQDSHVETPQTDADFALVVSGITPGGCPADVDGSGAVDVLDLLAVLSAWGPCPGCAEDVNADGVVSVLDLLEVLSSWGPC